MRQKSIPMQCLKVFSNEEGLLVAEFLARDQILKTLGWTLE